jgi:RecJ-like exonuclease
MKLKTYLITLTTIIAFVSCARMDSAEKRYEETQCPFCSTKAGVCSPCAGTHKCNICKGTGKAVSLNTETGKEIKKSISVCTFCNGTGICNACKGSGSCWACKGTGKVATWDFYNRYLAEKKPGIQ